MSAEWVSAIAAAGTLIVIAATAFAALVQLRHIRAANQLTGLLHFTDRFESDEIQSANVFIERELPQRLRESTFVNGLLEANTDRREHPELRVCDFMEQQGSYIKYRMIDREQYMDLVGAYVTSMWDALRGVVAIRRTARNSAVTLRVPPSTRQQMRDCITNRIASFSPMQSLSEDISISAAYEGLDCSCLTWRSHESQRPMKRGR